MVGRTALAVGSAGCTLWALEWFALPVQRSCNATDACDVCVVEWDAKGRVVRIEMNEAFLLCA